MEIIKNKYGFYSVKNLPTKEELEQFYKNKYFQENNSVYQHIYSSTELTYINNKSKVSEFILNSVNVNSDNRKILDVGAGEGYLSKYFFEKGYDVTCLDFSDYGIRNHNPEIISTLIQGDVLELLDKVIADNKNFDFINLSNILEHVIDPIGLLETLKPLLLKESLLRISVPNDYSSFQQFLQEKNYTTNTWLCPPEHLHYFTFKSLSNLLLSLGYEVVVCMGEFPIELYLSNESSNYVKNKEVGKFAHKSRIEVDNFLFEQGIEKYINFYKACADIDLSRQVVIYAKLKEI